MLFLAIGLEMEQKKQPPKLSPQKAAEEAVVVATEVEEVAEEETAVTEQPIATDAPPTEDPAIEAATEEPTEAPPTQIPVDTTISRGDILFDGTTLTATIGELIPLNDEDDIFAVWLTEPDAEPLFLGLVAPDGGKIAFTSPDEADLLASFSSFIISKEPATDGEPPFGGPIIFEATMDEQVVADYRHLQETLSIPLADAINNNMLTQANSFTDHTRFSLTDLLTNGSLGGGKLHAEHTINIASGTASDDFFDWDGNGQPENPGDDVGLLPYVRLFANAVTATDPDQAETINALIAQIENHVSLMSKITASDTLEEATIHAEQLDAEQGEILAQLTTLLEEADTTALSPRFEIFATGN